MSREDANLVIALASLVVAVVATYAAAVAIRRDRADLRAIRRSGGDGSAGVTIVNVGLRAVRVEQLVMRRWRFGVSSVAPLEASVLDRRKHLPIIMEPGVQVKSQLVV